MKTLNDWNGARYPRFSQPMYESYFLRGNHPSDGRAFWIRYTLFHGSDGTREGELWHAFFTGGRVISSHVERFPLHASTWSSRALGVEFPIGHLKSGHAAGKSNSSLGQPVHWDLQWTGSEVPLVPLQPLLYRLGFPKAKFVVPQPMARFAGHILTPEGEWQVLDWVGSQNHNWGVRHTDAYAWGQVMGFDGEGRSCLECASARLRMAGRLTPPLTIAVLRHGGTEYRFDSLWRAARAEAAFQNGQWQFSVSNGTGVLTVAFDAAQEAAVLFPYRNPPGGEKTCWNTKIARCTVRYESAKTAFSLTSEMRAAFEVLM